MARKPATAEEIEKIVADSIANPSKIYKYNDDDLNIVFVQNGESQTHETSQSIEAQPADASILEMFSDPDKRRVESFEVMVKDRPTLFYIEVLSTREAMILDGKKYVSNGRGRRNYDPAREELRGIANRIHRCVVQNVGTEEKPDWKPLFTYEQIFGVDAEIKNGKVVRQAVAGLLDNPDPEAKAFLTGLDSFVQAYNPDLSPLSQAQTLKEAGLLDD